MSLEPKKFSRREFIKLSGITAAGLVLASCAPKLSDEIVIPTNQAKNPNSIAKVAIAKAESYDRDLIDQKVWDLIDQLGGLGDVIKPGDKVAIKVNLTGGTSAQPLPGTSAIETYITHPEVVRALIKQIQLTGVKDIFIVEAVYEWASYQAWGYEDMAKEMGVTLIDLNQPKPYDDFIEVKVGDGSFEYDTFKINQLLKDVNVFMSVSKMKNHYTAGITHTMKNLVGMVPARFYEMNKGDGYRSGFHGTPTQTRQRLPRVIIDLNRVRPIHFSLIDGIMTTEGGEGPWVSTMTPIQPGVLIAGKNAVSTDAVATAAMGHNPTANFPDAPFYHGDNHLNLAAAAGMGSNRLEDIEIVGTPLKDVTVKFHGAE